VADFMRTPLPAANMRTDKELMGRVAF
jgi:hypothetical protein